EARRERGEGGNAEGTRSPVHTRLLCTNRLSARSIRRGLGITDAGGIPRRGGNSIPRSLHFRQCKVDALRRCAVCSTAESSSSSARASRRRVPRRRRRNELSRQ